MLGGYIHVIIYYKNFKKLYFAVLVCWCTNVCEKSIYCFFKGLREGQLYKCDELSNKNSDEKKFKCVTKLK